MKPQMKLSPDDPHISWAPERAQRTGVVRISAKTSRTIHGDDLTSTACLVFGIRPPSTSNRSDETESPVARVKMQTFGDALPREELTGS